MPGPSGVIQRWFLCRKYPLGVYYLISTFDWSLTPTVNKSTSSMHMQINLFSRISLREGGKTRFHGNEVGIHMFQILPSKTFLEGL